MELGGKKRELLVQVRVVGKKLTIGHHCVTAEAEREKNTTRE